jgi:hypothetical protein
MIKGFKENRYPPGLCSTDFKINSDTKSDLEKSSKEPKDCGPVPPGGTFSENCKIIIVKPPR